MLVSFGGIPLLLQDPEGIVGTMLERHLDETCASIFCELNTAIIENRADSIRNNTQTTVRHVGIPVGNYPLPPKPRINSLYWPTGAKRWSHGLFLIDGENLATILAGVANNSGGTLSIVDDVAGLTAGVNTTMYLLPPRPISPPGVNENSRLWLLPLVDARYFWQQDYVVGAYNPYSWETAVSAIQGTSRVDIVNMSSPPAAYGIPHQLEFQRDFEQVAMLIDGIALTLQRRVVATPTVASTAFAQYSIQTAFESQYAATSNFVQPWDIIAGGGFTAQAASIGTKVKEVVVTFTKSNGARIAGYAGGINADPTNRGVKVFHCSANGSNDSTVDGLDFGSFQIGLASQVSVDYTAWQAYHYDVTYASIVPWIPSGFDDYVMWDVSVRGTGKKRRYVAQTRAVSMPPNFAGECLPIDNPTSTSSSGSVGSSGSGSGSGSGGSGSGGSGSGSGNCIDVVTKVRCVNGSLEVTYGRAVGC